MNQTGGMINAIIAIGILVVIVTILLNPLMALIDVFHQTNVHNSTIPQGWNPETGAPVSIGIPFTDQAEWLFAATGFFITIGVIIYLVRFAPTPASEQPGYGYAPPQQSAPAWRRYRR